MNTTVIHSRTTIKGTTRWPVEITYESYVPKQERKYSQKGNIRMPCRKCGRRFATGQGLALHMENYHS